MGSIHFPDRPVMSPLGHGLWLLADEYCVPVSGHWMPIPAGFRTDLASVPRLLRVLIQQDELGAAAPIGHDALYQWGGRIDADHTLTRRQVDAWFRLLMRLEQVPAWRRGVAWLAVRVAGWTCWRKGDRGLTV
jgi:hypothetical protein